MTNLSRRELLKKSTYASLAATMTSLGIPNESHASALSISALATMLKINPIDLEYKASGLCCPLCVGTTIVNHYLPVAFVEVVKGGTDSIIMDFGAGVPGSPLDLATTDKNYLSHNNSVRIWDIPYYVIDMAMNGQACRLCDRSAALPSPIQYASQIASIPIEIACGGGSAFQMALSKVMDTLLTQFPFQCVPQLMYDSAYDPSWRTGCRDIATAAALYGPGKPMCGDNVTGSIMSALGIDMTGGLDPCVGAWGPLYPRQMRVDGADALTAAALSAYRALHVAGYSTGTMPYKLDLGGKMKWVYPNHSMAMSPGIAGSVFNAGIVNQLDGHYGFVWYAPVTCCKDILSVTAPCIPAIPCQGSSFT